MIAAALSSVVKWLAPIGAAVWGKVVFVGSIALALLGVYAVIRKGGRDAERADTLQTGLVTIGKANKAAQTVDPSAKAIANDPNNLDRVL